MKLSLWRRIGVYVLEKALVLLYAIDRRREQRQPSPDERAGVSGFRSTRPKKK